MHPRGGSYTSSHGLTIPVSRRGAVVTYGLALWSHFAIPGESPLGVLFRTSAIPHSQTTLERSDSHWDTAMKTAELD